MSLSSRSPRLVLAAVTGPPPRAPMAQKGGMEVGPPGHDGPKERKGVGVEGGPGHGGAVRMVATLGPGSRPAVRSGGG